MKRIKRFNESEQVDVSTERVDEIIVDLKELTSTLDDKITIKKHFYNFSLYR